MNFNYILVGKKIKKIRKHKHLSQMSLAEKADKSPTVISLMESGAKGMSLATFVDLANALDVSADILLTKQLTNNLQAYSNQLAMLLSDCGAYSVDKFYRLSRGYKWWEDEQPFDEKNMWRSRFAKTNLMLYYRILVRNDMSLLKCFLRKSINLPLIQVRKNGLTV